MYNWLRYLFFNGLISLCYSWSGQQHCCDFCCSSINACCGSSSIRGFYSSSITAFCSSSITAFCSSSITAFCSSSISGCFPLWININGVHLDLSWFFQASEKSLFWYFQYRWLPMVLCYTYIFCLAELTFQCCFFLGELLSDIVYYLLVWLL